MEAPESVKTTKLKPLSVSEYLLLDPPVRDIGLQLLGINFPPITVEAIAQFSTEQLLVAHEILESLIRTLNDKLCSLLIQKANLDFDACMAAALESEYFPPSTEIIDQLTQRIDEMEHQLRQVQTLLTLVSQQSPML